MGELSPELVMLAVGHGLLDDGLDEIYKSIERRRRAIAAGRASQLLIGDKFYITKITPKAFDGLRARVVGFKGTGIECVLIDPAGYVGRRGNYPAGASLTIPTICVGAKYNG